MKSPTMKQPNRHPLTVAGNSERSSAVILCLLLVGLALWLSLPAGPSGSRATLAPWRWIVTGSAALIALLPPVQIAGRRLGQWLRSPSVKTRAILGFTIAAAASLYFLLTAINQDRDFFPKTHDECSYLIQMRMLANGHLWMPRHELADFFDSFYLLTKPVYASMYFPGTAFMFVPSIWLHWPTWLIPLLVAGAIVGLVYRLVTEFVDGIAGCLAAILLLSLSWYRMLSIMLMSQLPVLLLGLILVWAWSRWRTGKRWGGWLLLIGACAGWAAITRPLDALCFAMPVGLAIFFDLVRRISDPRDTHRRVPWACTHARGFPPPDEHGHEYMPMAPTQVPVAPRWRVVALLAAGALPFLILQLILNRGVTGHFLQTPFGLYAQRDFPGASYGFHSPPPQAKPDSLVAQKQLLYTKWAKPFIADHQPSRVIFDEWQRRIPLIADVTLPARPLLALLPVGLLGLRDKRRWLLFAPLPLFVLGYIGYTFFLEHYAVVVAPAVALLLVMAIERIARHWPRIAPPIISMVLALALTSLWEINRSISDEPFRSTWLRQLHNSIDTDAIVLFTFDLDPADSNLIQNITQEPVYNTDAAWPDDAPLIRAHDLGQRNVELFRYYATHAPNRMVYRLSRKTGRVETLGRARELWKGP